MATIEFGPFKGINQAVAPEFIGAGESPDAYNVDTSDGKLKAYRGSRTIVTKQMLYDVAPLQGWIDEIHNMFYFSTTNHIIIIARVTNVGPTGYETPGYMFFSYTPGATSCQYIDVLYEHDYSGFFAPGAGFWDAVMFNGSSAGDTRMYVIGTGSTSAYIRVSYTDGPGGGYEITPIFPTEPSVSGRAIASKNERVFVVNKTRNAIMYSKPYLPEDFGIVAGSPLTSGGEITIPTEGGDILSIIPFNEILVIFRKNAVYALYGRTPDEFVLDRLAGDIKPLPGRVAATYGGILYFVTHDGIAYFDGARIDYAPFNKKLYNTWARSIQKTAGDSLIISGSKLYCAIHSLDPGPGEIPDASVYVYDFDSRVWTALSSNSLYVDFMREVRNAGERDAYITYKTTGRDEIYLLDADDVAGIWCKGSEYEDGEKPVLAKWTTPIIGAGDNNIDKAVSELRTFGKCTVDNALEPAGNIKVTLNTWGRRFKTKSKIKKLREYESAKNIQMSGEGERFQYVIENVNGSVFDLSVLQVEVEGTEE